jgi:hypothetical protein
MAVTLYRQVGNGKARTVSEAQSRMWAPPDQSHRSLFPAVFARLQAFHPKRASCALVCSGSRKLLRPTPTRRKRC